MDFLYEDDMQRLVLQVILRNVGREFTKEDILVPAFGPTADTFNTLFELLLTYGVIEKTPDGKYRFHEYFHARS